jgi:hypothetical protein
VESGPFRLEYFNYTCRWSGQPRRNEPLFSVETPRYGVGFAEFGGVSAVCLGGKLGAPSTDPTGAILVGMVWLGSFGRVPVAALLEAGVWAAVTG